MKHILMSAALIALVATVGVAQDIETMMGGSAQIGAGLISEAWLHNPAVLGMQRTADGMDGGNWEHSASGVYEIDGETDFRSLTWGGHPHGQRWGVGAGIVDVEGSQILGLGAGWGTPNGRLSAGLNYRSVDLDGRKNIDVFDFAVGGRLSPICSAFTQGTWGIVGRDIGDQIDSTVDLGIGLEASLWRVAADLEDITNEVDTIFQIGVARRLGDMREWQLGAGLNDGDFTAGIIYRPVIDEQMGQWKIGVAWLEGDDGVEDAWVVGVGADW